MKIMLCALFGVISGTIFSIWFLHAYPIIPANTYYQGKLAKVTVLRSNHPPKANYDEEKPPKRLKPFRRFILKRKNMGQLSENVNPYPINVAYSSSPFYGNFTVPVPPGSVVTSGTWSITGAPVYASDSIYAPDNTSINIGNGGVYNMTSDDITGINNTGTFRYFAFTSTPSTYAVYITVTLYGTFPSKTVGITPATEPNPFPVTMMFYNKKRCKCMIVSSPQYVSRDISGLSFPLAYQFKLDSEYDWLQLLPGLFNFNGSNGNANCAIQVWEGMIAQNIGWVNSWVNKNPFPFHVQLAQSPVMIPWSKSIVGYIVITSAVNPAPTNTQIEFIMKGFTI